MTFNYDEICKTAGLEMLCEKKLRTTCG